MPKRKSWKPEDIPGVLAYLKRRKAAGQADTFASGHPGLEYSGDPGGFDDWLMDVVTPAGRNQLLNWMRVTRAKYGHIPGESRNVDSMAIVDLSSSLAAKLKGVTPNMAVVELSSIARDAGVSADLHAALDKTYGSDAQPDKPAATDRVCNGPGCNEPTVGRKMYCSGACQKRASRARADANAR